MRCLLALLTYGLGCQTAFAETKRDIRGFTVGLSKEALDEKLAAANCKSKSCQLEDGILYFTLTDHLNNPVLMKVQFEYSSGTPPEEMVALVSRQYGLIPKPSNLRQDIARAKEGYLVQVPIFNTVVRSYGGQIAAWDLGSGQALGLHILTPGNLNKYSLILKSDVIAKEDEATYKHTSEAEAARKRSVNPTPRF